MAKGSKRWRFFTKKQQSTSQSRAPNLYEEERTPAKTSPNHHAEPSGISKNGGSWFVRKGGKKQDCRTRKSTQQHNETFETAGTTGDKDSADDNANIKNLQEPNLYLFPDLHESVAADELGDTDDNKERVEENTMVEVMNEFLFDNGVSSEGVETAFARIEPDAQGRSDALTDMFGAGSFDCSQAVSFDENDAFPFTHRVSGNPGLSQPSNLVCNSTESTRESCKATASRCEGEEPSKAINEIQGFLSTEQEHDLGFAETSTLETKFAVQRVHSAPAPDTGTFNFAFNLPAALERKNMASPTNEDVASSDVVPVASSFGFNLSPAFGMQDSSSSPTGGVTSNKAEWAPPSAASSVFSFGSHLPMTLSIQDLVSTTVTTAQYPTHTLALEGSTSEDADESTQGVQEVEGRLAEAADEIDESMEPSIEAKIRSPNESTTNAPFEEENTTLPADFPVGWVDVVFQSGSPALSDGNSIPTQHAYLVDATDDRIAFDDLSGRYCYTDEPSAVAKAIDTRTTVTGKTVDGEIQKEPDLNGNIVPSQQSHSDAPGALSDPQNPPNDLSFKTNNTRRSCDSRNAGAPTSETSPHVGFARPSAHLPHPCTTPLEKSWQGEGSNSEPRKITFDQGNYGGSPNDDVSLGFQRWEATSIGMGLADERLPNVTQLLLDGRVPSNAPAWSGAGGQVGIECRAEFVPDLDSLSESCASEVQNEDAELVDISQARSNERPTLLTGGIKRRTGRTSHNVASNILAPAKQNYRKLCTKLIQKRLSERRGDQKIKSVRSSNTEGSIFGDNRFFQGQPKNGSHDVADPEESEEAPGHTVSSAVVTVAPARPKPSTPHSAAVHAPISLPRSHTKPPVILPMQEIPIQDDCSEGQKHSDNSHTAPHASVPRLTSVGSSQNKGDDESHDYKFVCVDEDSQEDSQFLNRTDSAREPYRDSVPEDEVQANDSSQASNQARSVKEEGQGSRPQDKVQPCKEGSTGNVADFGVEGTVEQTEEATEGRDTNYDATETQSSKASKVPSFSFIASIAGLDRCTNAFECPFLAGDAEDIGYSDIDDYEDSECRCEEDDSITTYDKDAYESLGAGRSTIEEDVEDALEWADEHVLLCGRHRY